MWCKIPSFDGTVLQTCQQTLNRPVLKKIIYKNIFIILWYLNTKTTDFTKVQNLWFLKKKLSFF